MTFNTGGSLVFHAFGGKMGKNGQRESHLPNKVTYEWGIAKAAETEPEAATSYYFKVVDNLILVLGCSAQ